MFPDAYFVLKNEPKNTYYKNVTITLKNVRIVAEKVFMQIFSFVIAAESVTIST